MDKSQRQVRPDFVLGLFLLFFFACAVGLLAPATGGKKRAQIVITRFETKKIAAALYERAATGSLSNIDNEFILHAVFGTNAQRIAYRSNTNGGINDMWEIPYRIVISGRTNFCILSAGPDKTFGDKDDIVFDSVRSDFLKP